MAQRIKYPIGEQSFREIIRNGSVYVDKTMYISRLVSSGKYYFLSRPRRFGKSLLVSTLEQYFRGNRELFAGLAIDRLEPDEWARHAVLHLDLNGKNYTTDRSLLSQLNYFLDDWEKEYGCKGNYDSVYDKFRGIIEAACERTGRGVVVLVDEYDKPIIDVSGNDALERSYRNILRGFYGVMKSCSDCLKFVLLTGVGKLGQINVFSGLNNIRDISMSPEYSAICGITDEELRANFREGIEALGQEYGWDYEETVRQLKENYDGYHFARDLKDIYNPFSLLNALEDRHLDKYWYHTGTPTMLYDRLRNWEYPLGDLEGVRVYADTLNDGDVLGDELEVLFYYTGYLTIRDYIRGEDGEQYVLGYPNAEVRSGFFNGLVKASLGMNDRKRMDWTARLRGAVRSGDIVDFLRLMQQFMAGNSYRTNPNTEVHYQDLVYIISRLIGLNADVERATSDGRIDMILDGPKTIYIIEVKLDQTALAALRQIQEKHYDLPYLHLGKPIVKVGVNISSATRTLDSWLIERP